jgi:hypothetical protein
MVKKTKKPAKRKAPKLDASYDALRIVGQATERKLGVHKS